MSTKLEPGTYRLTVDVKNPNPDRRQKHNWSKQAVWEAGLVIKVEPYRLRDDTPTPEEETFRMWAGQYSSGPNFASWEEEWELLAPHLERLDDTPSRWLDREHPGMSVGRAILDRLVADGKVTLDDCKAALEAVYAED